MSENWHTGQCYRVVETGEIGQLLPCSCDNPIILEFKDGIRDAFFLRELEPTTHPITASYPTRGSANKNGVKGRPKGLARRTVAEDAADLRIPQDPIRSLCIGQR